MSNEETHSVYCTCACVLSLCLHRQVQVQMLRAVEWHIEAFCVTHSPDRMQSMVWHNRTSVPCRESGGEKRKLVFDVSQTLVLVASCFPTNNCCDDSCYLYHLTYIGWGVVSSYRDFIVRGYCLGWWQGIVLQALGFDRLLY